MKTKLPLETMQEIRRMKARIRQRNRQIRTLKEKLTHGVVLERKPPQTAPVASGLAKAIAHEIVAELVRAA